MLNNKVYFLIEASSLMSFCNQAEQINLDD